MDSIARRPWRLVVLGVAALAGLFYSLSGYAMAGSFTISNPEQLSHGQRGGGCVPSVRWHLGADGPRSHVDPHPTRPLPTPL